MLDGKQYYAAFPDEDPVLQPRIAAVLRALGKVDKALRKRADSFRAEEIKAQTISAPPLAPQ
jgi:hypothetical protein